MEIIESEEETKKPKQTLEEALQKFKNKYYLTFENDKICCWQDIYFDDYCSVMLMYMIFIKGKEFDSLKEYFDWVLNDIDSNLNKKIDEYIEKFNFGYDNVVEAVCPTCKKKHNVEIPMTPKFFFH